MSTEALQAAFAAIDAHASNELDAATAKGLMTGYHQLYAGAGVTVAEDEDGNPCVEQEFHLPIINPETGRSSRTWTYAGKFDGVVDHDGKRLLLEHKTTTDKIDDPTAGYWMRLDIDSQIDTYSLANLQLGVPVDGILYDVIRKPCIKPIRRGREETIAEYQIRLGEDTIARPEFYFGRKVIYRLENQMVEAACEMWDTAQEMQQARRLGRHYRNSNACLAWRRPCEFLPICSGRCAEDDPRYSKRENILQELPIVSAQADTQHVLTHSRMSVFKQCRRKAHLRYDQGLRKSDLEESQALVFGTLLHLALAAWFLCFRKEAVNA